MMRMMKPDLLDSTQFEMEPMDRIGLGGQIYLAKPIVAGKSYLLKYQYPQCFVNEYLARMFLRALGYPSLTVQKMICPAEEKRDVFRSMDTRFLFGMEYVYDAAKITFDKFSSLTGYDVQKQYFKYLFLDLVFCNGEGCPEILQDKGGTLYKIDHSEILLDDGTIIEAMEGRTVGIMMKLFLDKQRPPEHLQSFIQSYIQTWYEILGCEDTFTRADVNKAYQEFLQELAGIDSAELLNALAYLKAFYPPSVLRYYGAFILQTREDAAVLARRQGVVL